MLVRALASYQELVTAAPMLSSCLLSEGEKSVLYSCLCGRTAESIQCFAVRSAEGHRTEAVRTETLF